MTVDPTWQQMATVIVAVVLPLLVGLVTKSSWGGNVRAIVLALLSALTGLVQGFISAPPGTTWDWKAAVFAAVLAWVIAVATHFGLWKPVGASNVVQGMFVKDAPAEPMEAAA